MFELERLGKWKLKIVGHDYVYSLAASQYLQGSSGHCMNGVEKAVTSGKSSCRFQAGMSRCYQPVRMSSSCGRECKQ